MECKKKLHVSREKITCNGVENWKAIYSYVKEREVGKYEEKKTKCSSKWIDDVCVIF